MPHPKTNCRHCKYECRISISEKYQGLCHRCAFPRVMTGTKTGRSFSLDEMGEALGLGIRFLRGLFVAVLLAGIGWTISFNYATPICLGILSIPLALSGFVYGFFLNEINLMVRTGLYAFLKMTGWL